MRGAFWAACHRFLKGRRPTPVAAFIRSCPCNEIVKKQLKVVFVFCFSLIGALYLFQYGLGTVGPANHLRGENSLILERIDQLNSDKPGIVFLGTSVCTEGVDEVLMSKTLGINARKYCGHIQKTLFYYLFTKNVLLDKRITKRPSTVVILFAGKGLTEIREKIFYDEEFYVNTLSTDDDDHILQELLYLANRKPLLTALVRHSFFLTKLEVYRQFIKNKISEITDLITNSRVDGLRVTTNRIFQPEKMMKHRYELEIEKVMQRSTGGPESQSFARMVEKTALPRLIEVSQQNGLQLIAVHMPMNYGLDESPEGQNLRTYFEDLELYLAASGIPFINLRDSDEFNDEHFPVGDGVHLGHEGRKKFAKVFGEIWATLEAS